MTPTPTEQAHSPHLLRRLLAVIFGLALVGGLTTACSSSGSSEIDDETASSPAERPLPTAEGKIKYPLEIDSPYGTSTLEKRPERVASAGYIQDLQILLALGVTPITYSEGLLERPFFEDYADQLGNSSEIPYFADDAVEKLGDLDPDLIVSMQSKDPQNAYDKLTAIAPLVPGRDDVHEWETLTENIGKSLDLEDSAATIIEKTKHRLTEAMEENPEFRGKSISVLYHGKPGESPSLLNYEGTDAAELFTDLGFSPNSYASELSGSYGKLSQENLSQADADVILVIDQAGTFHDDFDNNDIWRSLSAVSNGNVAYLSETDTNMKKEEIISIRSAMQDPGPLTIPYAIEHIVDPLKRAIG